MHQWFLSGYIQTSCFALAFCRIAACRGNLALSHLTEPEWTSVREETLRLFRVHGVWFAADQVSRYARSIPDETTRIMLGFFALLVNSLCCEQAKLWFTYKILSATADWEFVKR